MTQTVIKPCKWCNAPMQTTRSSKKLCSKACHAAFHRWRQTMFLTNKEGYQVIENWLAEGTHPNQQNPINQADAEKAKLIKAATNVLKAEGALLTALAELRKIEEETTKEAMLEA